MFFFLPLIVLDGVSVSEALSIYYVEFLLFASDFSSGTSVIMTGFSVHCSFAIINTKKHFSLLQTESFTLFNSDISVFIHHLHMKPDIYIHGTEKQITKNIHLLNRTTREKTF